VTEAELVDYARERTARYPRSVWFASALPHGSTGKVLKRAIQIPAAREIAA
jgi:long-chain acyl-CoA synthetase